jgi:hypothetical protein
VRRAHDGVVKLVLYKGQPVVYKLTGRTWRPVKQLRAGHHRKSRIV